MNEDALGGSDAPGGSTASPSASAIPDRLAALNIDVASSEVVSSREERFSVVYEVVAGSGETYYVESLEPARASRFRTLLADDAEVAVPIVSVLDGDPPLLVMRAARGRPLSVVLPIGLLPGVWHVRRDSLRAGIRSLGRNLGRLHAAGPTERAPYGDSDVDDRKLGEVGEDLDRLGLDADCQTQVRDVVASLRDVPTVHAMAHRDPSPHNVYYDDGDVELIDVDLSVRPAVVDVTLAEIGIELMVGRLPYASRTAGDALTTALREGYDETGPALSRDGDFSRRVRIVQLCELLGNYVRQEVYSLSGRLTARRDPPIVRRLVEQACRERRADGSA